MLTFGIDWDDVISPLNECAIELANQEYKFDPPLSLEEINSWENTGRASVIKKYYNDPRLYEMQRVSDEAKAFIRKLQTKGIVYIVTAVQPQFMSKRVEQIKTAFPDFPDENIIMGFQKSVVQVDITLDDGPHNILKSIARFPVLMRRPWNRELTGLLAVNNYEEFFQLLEQIKSSMVEDRVEPSHPCVFALVGPSGAKKNEIAKKLCETGRFVIPKAYTTKAGSDSIHTTITEEEFIRNSSEFIETTRYAGYAYGTKWEDISTLINKGRYVVMPMDLSGAIAMKRHYPTVIIFCKCKREKMIENILEKNMSNHEKMLRLVSMENELKNADLCDFVVRTDTGDAAETIMTDPFKENPFDEMADKDLADVAKNIWDSKRNGERAESLIPYAEQISEAISGKTAEPLVSKNVCLDIAKDMFYDALCGRFCEVVADKKEN